LQKLLIVATCFLSLSACTTVSVQKVDAVKYPMQLVCIEENSKVLVSDFISVLESGFQRHNITTTIYRDKVPERCEYTLWYTAFRGWDLAPFLEHAELRLRKGDNTIASATYHHSGGLGLNKWASTENKLNPVIDELLAGFWTK
jgi:hypothetical protein